jgi:hypothetical protein
MNDIAIAQAYDEYKKDIATLRKALEAYARHKRDVDLHTISLYLDAAQNMVLEALVEVAYIQPYPCVLDEDMGLGD